MNGKWETLYVPRALGNMGTSYLGNTFPYHLDRKCKFLRAVVYHSGSEVLYYYNRSLCHIRLFVVFVYLQVEGGGVGGGGVCIPEEQFMAG